MQSPLYLRSLTAIGLLVFSAGAPAAGSAPAIGGSPPPRVFAGHPYFFAATANDPEGDVLTFSIRNKPRWATFWPGSGRLFGTPPPGDARRYDNIVIEVSDGTSVSALSAFSIFVDPTWAANQRPSITGNPASSVQPDQWYGFSPQGLDADGHSLTYAIGNRPSWATFNRYTGQLYGRPSASDAGDFNNIGIWVTDGQKTSRLPAFDLRVENPVADPTANTAPTISGTPPAAVVVGNTWSLKVVATDVDGDALTFSIRNKPSWATFRPGEGRLFGKPDSGDTGWHGNIQVSVSDGQSSTRLPAFAIRVDPESAPNAAPVISGTPKTTAKPARWYMFEPLATDANGHALNFAIQNKPSWAGFESLTGKLYGRPSLGDTGTFSNIRISVTDGIATRSLPAFSILVAEAETGTVTLSWTPPTRNTDGSPLLDLAGYRILYGTTPGTYPLSVELGNPGLTSYVMEGLSPGTYYFVSTAINSAGVESSYSGMVQKTIN